MQDTEREKGIEHGLKQGMLYLVGHMLHEGALRRVRGMTDATQAFPAQVPCVTQQDFSRLVMAPQFCDEDAQKLRAEGYSEDAVAQYREQAGARERDRQQAMAEYKRDHPRTPQGVLKTKFAPKPMRLIVLPQAPSPLQLQMRDAPAVQVLNWQLSDDMSLEHVVADAEAVGKLLLEGAELSPAAQILFDFSLIGPQLLHMALCVKG